VKLEYIDIPKMHTFTNEEANLFMEQLAETDDMELFNRKVVRKIIEFKWPLAREYTIKKQLIPFLLFQITYLIWVNEFYNTRNDSETLQNVNYSLMGALTIFSLYFLGLEAVQVVEDKCHYFTSIWNYLDIIPPILLLVFFPLVLVGTFEG
jgi:hypothetical protein